MSEPGAWLAARVAAAPEALRVRIGYWTPPAGTETSLASDLVAAGRRALAAAVARGRDRAAALDLLAADALVTLALLRQAESDPGGLEAFAHQVRMDAGHPE